MVFVAATDSSRRWFSCSPMVFVAATDSSRRWWTCPNSARISSANASTLCSKISRRCSTSGAGWPLVSSPLANHWMMDRTQLRTACHRLRGGSLPGALCTDSSSLSPSRIRCRGAYLADIKMSIPSAMMSAMSARISAAERSSLFSISPGGDSRSVSARGGRMYVSMSSCVLDAC